MIKLLISPFLFIFISTSAQTEIIEEFSSKSKVQIDSMLCRNKSILLGGLVPDPLATFFKSKPLCSIDIMPVYSPPDDLVFKMPTYHPDPDLHFNMPIANMSGHSSNCYMNGSPLMPRIK